MKKVYSCIWLLSLFSISLAAQNHAWQWAKSDVQPDNYTTYSGAIASAIDNEGNVVVAGFFWTDSIKFGNYALYNSLPNGASNDVYVVKYDPTGRVLWASKFGSTGYDFPDAITTDKNGNTYVTGGFTSAFISAGSSTISNHDLSDTTTDLYLLKINPSGTLLWAVGFGGDYNDQGNGLGTDAAGNVYIAAFYESDSLSVGENEYYNSTHVKDHNDLLIKCDSAGNVLWAQNSVDVNGGTEPYALAVDQSGNAYMAGRFNGTSVTFDGQTIQNELTGWNDIYLVKYDASGNARWAADAGGSLDDLAQGVAVDGQGNSYLTGFYNSPNAFFGSLQIANDSSDGSGDIFLAKYDTSGNVQWVQSFGSDQNDVANAVSLDTDRNIYITGYYYSANLAFGNTTITNTDNSGQTDDVFVTTFDQSGNATAAVSAGGLSYDYGSGISADLSGNVYVAGVFESDDIIFGSTTLDNGATTHNNTPFVAKYANMPNGINDLPQMSSLSIYPNPANDIITAQSASFTSDNVIATVYDLTGKAISVDQTLSEGQIRFATQALAPGMYFIKFMQDGKETQARFVKISTGQ